MRGGYAELLSPICTSTSSQNETFPPIITSHGQESLPGLDVVYQNNKRVRQVQIDGNSKVVPIVFLTSQASTLNVPLCVPFPYLSKTKCCGIS